MSSEGIQIPIIAEDEFSDTFNAAQSSLSEFSNSIQEVSSSESELGSSTNEMTTSMNQMTESTQGMQESVASSNANFSESATQIGQVSATMAMGVGAAYSLGDAYMQAQDASLKLQNAHQNLAKQQDIVTQDQEKLAYAQQKLTDLQNSGKASATSLAAAQQAVTTASDTLANAQVSLQNAQNNVTAAQNRSTMAHEHENMALLQTATTVPMLISQLPEMIGFITGYGAAEDALTLSQIAQSAATGIASGAMTLFDAVMDANPVILVVLAIGGLVAALAYLTDGFKNFGPLEKDFNNAWKDLHAVFNDVISFIRSDVYPVLGDLYKIYIQPIISAINTIKGIGSSISGGLSSLGKDLGILGLAQGGIVTQPTLAMIGEEGPEAVLPLSDYNITAPKGFQSLPQINSATTTTNTSSIRTATINIQQSNQISSNVDANNLAQSLANQIAQRLTMGY